MEDNFKPLQAVDAIRKAINAKGQMYAGTAVKSQWLASEDYPVLQDPRLGR